MNTFKSRIERKYIGKYRSKIEALNKASGRTKYIEDITLKRNFPGLLYARFLRSPYAHAVIKDFDSTKAEQLPGVRAIISYKDPEVANFPRINGSWTDGASNANFKLQWFPLFRDRKILDNRVRCVGDYAGIMIAADSEEIAEEALELLDVDWEVLPHSLSIEDSLKEDAPIIHEEINPDENILPWDPIAGPFTAEDGERVATFAGEHEVEDRPYTPVNKGDVDKGFNESDVIVETHTRYSDPIHAYLESWSCLATWEDDELVLYSRSYEADQTRLFLSDMLNMPINKVRCISTYIGGSFGSGNTGEQPFFLLCSLLSKRTGRPVKFKQNRRETFEHGRTAAIQHCKIGAKNDGEIISLFMAQNGDAGAYADLSPAALGIVPTEVAEVMCYHIPNIRFEAKAIYTNRTASSCMRCIGNIQANFAIMAGVQKLAETLGIDPIEILIKNFGDHSPKPNFSIKSALEAGAEKIGWYEKKHEPGKGQIYDQTKRRGIGVGIHNMWHTAPQEIRRGPMQVTIWVNPDGSVNLDAPTVETGTGSNSCAVFACADALGVAPESISWHSVIDTRSSMKDQVQTDSAISHILPEGIHVCALKAKKKLLEKAAPRLKVKPEELDIENGVIFSKKSPDKQLTIKQLLEGGDLVPIVTNVSHDLPEEDAGVPFEATFIEVEVDTETGEVKIINFVIVTDMGTVMFPPGAEGQLIGGQVQALGEAFTEYKIYDEKTGIPLNFNFIDYKIHTSVDFPKITPVIAEYWKGNGEYGACGIGEGTLTNTPRALSMAIYNAIGVSIDDLPITPDKILKKLKTN